MTVLRASAGLPVQRVQFSALGIFLGLRRETGSVMAKLSIVISCCVKVPRPRDKILMIAPMLAKYLGDQRLLEDRRKATYLLLEKQSNITLPQAPREAPSERSRSPNRLWEAS